MNNNSQTVGSPPRVAIVGATKKVIRSLDDQKKNLPEYKEAKGFVDLIRNSI